MIRKSLFAVAASVMTLTAFSGTLGMLSFDDGRPGGSPAAIVA